MCDNRQYSGRYIFLLFGGSAPTPKKNDYLAPLSQLLSCVVAAASVHTVLYTVSTYSSATTSSAVEEGKTSTNLMSKYKGSNYGGGGGNSRANAAAASSSSSSSSSPSTIESLSSLVDLLDSYGFDLPAMLLLFWLLLFFLVVGGVNLYLALVRRRQQQQQKLADQKQKVNSASSDQRSPESEALLRTSSAANSCQSSPPPKRKPNYALEEDEEGRRWIAKVIDWLYNRGNLGAGGGEVSQSVEAWLTALNAKSAQLTVEVGSNCSFNCLLSLYF